MVENKAWLLEGVGTYLLRLLSFIILFAAFSYDNRLLCETLNYIMKMLLLFVLVVVV